jgi:hypothetical protein
MRFADIPDDLLPSGTQPWEVDAADRMVRGEKLGPRARRSALRLLKRLQDDGRAKREEADMRDEFYRQQLREAAGAARAAIPGAGSSPSPSARPAPVLTGISAGRGAPSMRHVDNETFRARVAGMGLDTSFLESRLQPPRQAPNQYAARVAAAREERQRKAREQNIAAGRIDGRGERREVVAMRMYELGIRDAQLAEGFRDPPPPLPPVEQRTDPQAKAQAKMRAEVLAAEQWARHALATGEKIDAASLSEAAFAALLKMKGLQVVGSGPGFNAPLPR